MNSEKKPFLVLGQPLQEWVTAAEQAGQEAIQRHFNAGRSITGLDENGNIIRVYPDGLQEPAC